MNGRNAARVGLLVLAVLSVFVACQPVEAPADLQLSLNPKSVRDGTPITVTVTGTGSDGLIGKGSVKVSSNSGSLIDGEDLTFDAYGTASTTFTCDPGVDPACAQRVTVKGRWVPASGPAVESSATLNADGVPTGGVGGGIGTGTGGGTGNGGGPGSNIPCGDQDAFESPNGCCKRLTQPTCGALRPSHGQRYNRAYIDTATGQEVQIPIVFELPPVDATQCFTAKYGFRLDFSAFDAGLISTSIGCSSGVIRNDLTWVKQGGGACPSDMALWAYFDCDRVLGDGGIRGTWTEARLTANPPFSDVQAAGRTFQLKDAGSGTIERYIIVLSN